MTGSVWLIENSGKPSEEEWFQSFRTMISESISLVDNTLHQIYFKAQYDPSPGWRFDPAALGERHGRRMTDKLKWVHQITGKELNVPAEMADFETVKGLRNHLQHFDPPCFAYTWEEVATWLNQVLGVARLTWRIRTNVNVMPSRPLISLLLQKNVRFAPKDPAKPRVRLNDGCGYASTCPAVLLRGAPTLGPEVIILQATREEDVI